MASLFRIKPFTGESGAPENAEDYLDDIECAAELILGQGNADEKMYIRLFRQNLEGTAYNFWRDMEPELKTEWGWVKKLFLINFGGSKYLGPLLDRMHGLAQRERTIDEYVSEAKKLFRELPKEYEHSFTVCFVHGLDDGNKKDGVSNCTAILGGGIEFTSALYFVNKVYGIVQ